MTNGTSISIHDPVTLQTVAHYCRRARVLRCSHHGLISKVNDEALPPMVHTRELAIQGPLQGAEYLLDRRLLPNLRSIRSDCSSLFHALMRMSSTSPGVNALDHIERLELIEREDSFSLKQWYTILDAFPRLRSLSLSFVSQRCPPNRCIDVLIGHLQSKKTDKLVLLSVSMSMLSSDGNKADFMIYFRDCIRRRTDVRSLIKLANARFDAWF